ncbi:MAG: alpha-ketoacid dehydrogenase subunit beta [Chloroflexi bacterium]|nr:alpha-ketoacid dehydrogenase subunit beta [Chloroflexota bacterium]
MRYVESLNNALHKMMDEDDRVFVLGEDILDPYGGAFRVTKGLSSCFPGRVITTPISEASITGFATGMALRGMRPVVEIMFGDFITLCADQIVNAASKLTRMYGEQVEVPLVIRAPMGGRRGYGPTHSQTLESLFLNVPGLTIVAPSHFHDPGELLHRAVLGSKGPILFVENKLLYPLPLSQPDGAGRIGDFFAEAIQNHSSDFPSISLRLTEGKRPDVTLIAYGGMAPLAAEAALKVFLHDEVVVEVIVPSLVKPFPLADVLPSAQASGKVVIAEEAVRTSGWGAELASQVYESAFNSLAAPIRRLGARELPIPSSRPLEDQVLPQVADIEAAIYQQLEVVVSA